MKQKKRTPVQNRITLIILLGCSIVFPLVIMNGSNAYLSPFYAIIITLFMILPIMMLFESIINSRYRIENSWTTRIRKNGTKLFLVFWIYGLTLIGAKFFIRFAFQSEGISPELAFPALASAPALLLVTRILGVFAREKVFVKTFEAFLSLFVVSMGIGYLSISITGPTVITGLVENWNIQLYYFAIMPILDFIIVSDFENNRNEWKEFFLNVKAGFKKFADF